MRYIRKTVTSANAERERYRAQRNKTRSVFRHYSLFIIQYSSFIKLWITVSLFTITYCLLLCRKAAIERSGARHEVSISLSELSIGLILTIFLSNRTKEYTPPSQS